MLGLYVPLYAYPTPEVLESVWRPVAEELSKHPQVCAALAAPRARARAPHGRNSRNVLPAFVIVNPEDGPKADRPNTDYEKAIRLLSQHGVHMIGYIKTEWGKRSLERVYEDIRRYEEWGRADPALAMSGIFVDEAPNAWMGAEDGAKVARDVAFYQAVYRRVKAAAWRPGLRAGPAPAFAPDGDGLVVLNPGSHTLQCYLDHPGGPCGDVVVLFENEYDSGRTRPKAKYWDAMQWAPHRGRQFCDLGRFQRPFLEVSHFPRERFAAMMYETEARELPSALKLAEERRFGWFYATDDSFKDGNPWDAIPSYWPALVRSLAAGHPIPSGPSSALHYPSLHAPPQR
eukprot:tig00000553_g2076.t1